jgi:hypothetical protein
MRSNSPIYDIINIIKNNINLNIHEYQCKAYQGDGLCDCDDFTDDEIAVRIFESYGYKLEKK